MPLYHQGEYAIIEIHKDALSQSAARTLPTQLIWERVEPVDNELGIAMSVLCQTHRILHNLLHSNLDHNTYTEGKISLRSLHELVMMQFFYRESIDWETIQKLMERGGYAKILAASLYLAHRLFSSPIPGYKLPTRGAVFYYTRSRLQFRWYLINKLVELALWFSSESIRWRYKCDDSFLSLTIGRIRLAMYLSGKYSIQAFRFIIARTVSD
jgi:hypothetical protein